MRFWLIQNCMFERGVETLFRTEFRDTRFRGKCMCYWTIE